MRKVISTIAVSGAAAMLVPGAGAQALGPAPAVAPEPETIVLLGVVLVAAAVYGLYKRKKRREK